jgi:7-cyano-7-deazaguanine synthase
VSVIAIVSGGLDSVVLAHLLHSQGREPTLLTFNYGQRHRREIDSARACAARLGVPHEVVDLSGLRRLLGGSSLTDDAVSVPHGHYAAPTMALTVVPNRNAIMLAIAYGVAVAAEAEAVATAVHAGDHFVYPDCRPGFIAAFEAMQREAVAGFGRADLRLLAPFVGRTKADVVRLGADLGIPFAETWSCYEGGAVHCARCGTCVERREAFDLAGVADPTEYAT